MSFPKDFLWGVSASGFQFEMGMSGGEDFGSDWFVWVHDRRNIDNKVVSGDFPEHGPGYWHFFREDHSLAARLGLNAYRLGVEWSRVFPRSTKNVEVTVERNRFGRISRITADEKTIRRLEEYADAKALNRYREIIRDVAAKKMEPVVCLNHFTLPLWMHDPVAVRDSNGRKGPRGWIDEQTVIEFWKFAAFVASRLGDLVDRWATFNEPSVVAEAGYLFPRWGFPPGLNSFTFFRRCLTNIAVAHARAYEAIKQFDTIEARPGNKAADVGLILNIIPMQPLRKDRDAEAAETASHIHNHFFLQAAVNGWVDENLNRRTEAREKDGDVGGRLDWVGVNYYSRNVVRGKRSLAAKIFAGLSVVPETVEGYGNSCKPNDVSAEGLPTSDFGWEIYPSGLEAALKLVAKYGKPLYVTENGVADAADRLRPAFIREHLQVLENVVEKEKLDIRGYFHWALIDNYEWAAGFKMRFGLCFVDMETKQRKPRKSFETYQTIVGANTSF